MSGDFNSWVEDVSVLAALDHRRLHDGRIVDARAEALLAIVGVLSVSDRPRLDTAGLIVAN